MEDKLNEILPRVTEIFMRFGFRSVTMDDIAKQLRISKKTLYQCVTDKKDLVSKCLEHGQAEDKCYVRDLMDQDINAIDQMFAISEKVVNQLKEVHPSVFFDLEKYYPEAWETLLIFKNDFIYGMILENINKGIEEGLYREDLNGPVIARVYVRRMDDVWSGELFPEEDIKLPEIYLELMRYHIRGIASQKGIDYLVEKVKNHKSVNS